jgi:hypothetical protein
LHRSHVVLYKLGCADQTPVAMLRAPPTLAVPEMVGTEVGVRVAPASAAGPTRLAYATFEPVESVTRTVNAIVLPASFAVTG